jgi:hypothetical protein
VTGRWFSPGSSVFSTNNTDIHDITEILLKVALKTFYDIAKTLVHLTSTQQGLAVFKMWLSPLLSSFIFSSEFKFLF